MARQAVTTPRAPAAIGPYSQAVRAGTLLFVSGQVPLDPATGTLVPGGIEAQTRQVLRNLQALFGHGRLAGTGYVSILPVDQGIEHSAGASFAPNPAYFDPANIVELALEGGTNAVASTVGVLGVTAALAMEGSKSPQFAVKSRRLP